MPDLVVITPTRGRPWRFDRLCETVRHTTNDRVPVIGLVDDDDPMLPGYRGLRWPFRVGSRRTLAGWTNLAATELLAGEDPPRYLASLGDDHRPRTMWWDRKLIEAIEDLPGPGFAYGNDLFQGVNMPTAWIVSAQVVGAVGWMMLPTCQHLYVDAAVLALGRAAGRIVYRPDVVIEHLHPAAGKADLDESYAASNSAARYEADATAFETWRRGGLAADVASVMALARTGGPR